MKEARAVFSRLRPDNFTIALVGCVVLAAFLPVQGKAAEWFGVATAIAIALLFFLHGARLSREAVIAGLTHWRLHLVVFASTFVLFPLIGLSLGVLVPTLLTPALYAGILYMCLLPSTVQSSIAFTSMAGGNVPAAVCSASASNIVGVFLTPALVSLFMHSSGSGVSFDQIEAIMLQLLAPFIAGQLVQPWLGARVARHKRLTMLVDRGSILMVVYLAFSEAVAAGLWQKLPLPALAVMAVICLLVLAAVLFLTTVGSRRLGFSRADEITIVFCGSKKSLASGVPMANVLFAGPDVGVILLPIMLFHQIQLIACAWLARRYARTSESAPAGKQV